MTKSEKRQFKLYVGRLGVNEDSKFLNLFNILDKAASYDEAAILKTGIVKKQQPKKQYVNQLQKKQENKRKRTRWGSRQQPTPQTLPNHPAGIPS